MTGPETSHGRRSAAVVSESMFGNTAALARQIALELGDQGFDVEVWDVEQAPPPARLDVDLLVVGAPTHAFSLSRPTTREDAVRQGADADRARTGMREWLSAPGAAREGRPRLAVFDTRAAKVRHLPGSAARAASHMVRRHHVGSVVGTESFYVDDVQGPLLEGELTRARVFARGVAASVPHPADHASGG